MSLSGDICFPFVIWSAGFVSCGNNWERLPAVRLPIPIHHAGEKHIDRSGVVKSLSSNKCGSDERETCARLEVFRVCGDCSSTAVVDATPGDAEDFAVEDVLADLE